MRSDQIRYLLLQYEGEIKNLEAQRDLLIGLISEAETLIGALEKTAPSSGAEGLAPIGRNVLLRIKVKETGKILTYLGSGVYAAYGVDELKGRLRERLKVLRENLDAVLDRLARIVVEYQLLLENVRLSQEKA